MATPISIRPVTSPGVGSNLTISGNTETLDNTGGNDTYDNNFVALFQETGVLITGNQITDNDASDPDADSAIYVGGGASDTTISDNTITGGLASGVNLTTDFYAGSSPPENEAACPQFKRTA